VELDSDKIDPLIKEAALNPLKSAKAGVKTNETALAIG